LMGWAAPFAHVRRRHLEVVGVNVAVISFRRP
jgi:hypothetical protein